MNVLLKSTNIIVMSLILFTAILLIGAVSNESVNKDKTVSTAVPPSQPLPPHNAAIDHSDLPTKFGDEDDVIEGKAAAIAAEKKASETAAVAANGRSDGKKHDHQHHYGFESGEDQYDDDEDFLAGEHFPDKNAHHDIDESDSDYEDESDLGPTLDNFGAKLDGTDTGNELPIFLVEPQSTYVVRNRAAILKCKAAHALQVSH